MKKVKLPTIPPGAVPAGVVVAGAAFSFASSVVPHFDAGHRLLVMPFGLGIALYALYGVIAALVPRQIADGLGLRLLGLHVAMGVLLRVTIDPRSVEGSLALVPLALILYALADVYLRRGQTAAT